MAGNTPLFLPEDVESGTAWMFPGQGAQVVGMGQDLWDGSPAAREIFETANRVLGYELTDVCFNGPEEKLRQTEFTQPAILATSLACLAAALESGRIDKRPAVMSGHSIGEYTALVAAEALSIEDGITLVQERARLMAECGRQEPGTMLAILGLEEEAVQAICVEADVDICNLNQATQIVIGGRLANLQRAGEIAKERGARVIELNVSSANHSRLMTPAVDGMRAALSKATVAAPKVPVIANLTATELDGGEAWKEELATQVASPVRWHESMQQMVSMGATKFIEFGPSKVLTTMAKRSFPEAQLVNVSGLADLVGTTE